MPQCNLFANNGSFGNIGAALTGFSNDRMEDNVVAMYWENEDPASYKLSEEDANKLIDGSIRGTLNINWDLTWQEVKSCSPYFYAAINHQLDIVKALALAEASPNKLHKNSSFSCDYYNIVTGVCLWTPAAICACWEEEYPGSSKDFCRERMKTLKIIFDVEASKLTIFKTLRQIRFSANFDKDVRQVCGLMEISGILTPMRKLDIYYTRTKLLEYHGNSGRVLKKVDDLIKAGKCQLFHREEIEGAIDAFRYSLRRLEEMEEDSKTDKKDSKMDNKVLNIWDLGAAELKFLKPKFTHELSLRMIGTRAMENAFRSRGIDGNAFLCWRHKRAKKSKPFTEDGVYHACVSIHDTSLYPANVAVISASKQKTIRSSVCELTFYNYADSDLENFHMKVPQELKAQHFGSDTKIKLLLIEKRREILPNLRGDALLKQLTKDREDLEKSFRKWCKDVSVEMRAEIECEKAKLKWQAKRAYTMTTYDPVRTAEEEAAYIERQNMLEEEQRLIRMQMLGGMMTG